MRYSDFFFALLLALVLALLLMGAPTVVKALVVYALLALAAYALFHTSRRAEED